MLTQIPKLDKQGIENGWMDAYTNIFFLLQILWIMITDQHVPHLSKNKKKTNSLTKEIIRL